MTKKIEPIIELQKEKTRLQAAFNGLLGRLKKNEISVSMFRHLQLEISNQIKGIIGELGYYYRNENKSE
jgi:hypothetical protein